MVRMKVLSGFSKRIPKKTKGLSTFSGVYLPTILQMLGIILFIRLGWITGHVGIFKMSVIIFMSSTILFLTTLSLTTIVTNMKVGSGGSYYIISRSLGMEFGSAIGILLCLAQLTTVAVCISGFALSVHEIWSQLPLGMIEFYSLIGVLLVASLPISFALKAQGSVFIIVLAAILSIFYGGVNAIPESITPLPLSESMTFWAAFALFFPATTGIEAGTAMSGDLKNPSRSIAVGCMGAVLTAYTIYVALTLFLSSKVPSDLLRSHPMIIYHVSKYSPLFVLGVWGATISNAVGGLLTAPRILQSLAKDKILPGLLSKEMGKTAQPIYAILLTIAVVSAITAFIDMDHLLPLVSMICLITYAMLNFVAFFESLLKNPSWRPLFKIHWILALAGTICCLIAMFMINAGVSFIVLFLVGALCFWTTKRKLKGNWDDIRYSLYSFFASTAARKLGLLTQNPRNWRPNILAITEAHLTNTPLIQFANCLNQSKGFLTFATTLTDKECKSESVEEVKHSFEDYFRKKDIPCFSHVTTHHTVTDGTREIIQNYGLGPLTPNTLILTPPHDPKAMPSFCETLYTAYGLGKNVIIFNTKPQRPTSVTHDIDLWWSGLYSTNFELSLALAHIIQTSKKWQNDKIIIKTIVKNEASRIYMTKLFDKYHKVLRFKNLFFKPYINETPDFHAHIADYSHDAALTFIGLRVPSSDEPVQEYADYLSHMIASTKNIPATAYVLAGEKLNFQKIFE